jgi:hypothetical protein
MQSVLDGLHAGAGILAVIALVLAIVCLAAAVVVARRAGPAIPADTGPGLSDDLALSDTLRDLMTRVQAMGKETWALDQRLDLIEAHSRAAVQRVGLVRFNPFSDTGGNQSFALALLDGDANGIVLTSLHSRAATRVYVKQVQAGRVDAGLSHEEAEALRQAGAPQVPVAVQG